MTSFLTKCIEYMNNLNLEKIPATIIQTYVYVKAKMYGFFYFFISLQAIKDITGNVNIYDIKNKVMWVTYPRFK